HYPATLEEGLAITAQEAWVERDGHRLVVPKFVREVIEQIAFAAREDKRIDKRSGVSQRLSITCMENVISNAERRALRNQEALVVPRIGDVYAAMPAITGKLELEYEGEMRGADNVVRELIRAAVARTFDAYFHGANLQQVVQWFDLGGCIKVAESAASGEVFEALKGIQGLNEKLGALGLKSKDSPELQVSAAEFVLEGLYAHKRIGRSEERVFSAGEKVARRGEVSHPDRGDEPPVPRPRRPYN
ncbi:MAG: magnesium chelatase, partial [Terriglobales bacterium]